MDRFITTLPPECRQFDTVPSQPTDSAARSPRRETVQRTQNYLADVHARVTG